MIVRLLWRTGMRTGSLRSLDINDYRPGKDRLELHHRPESDTPLKKGEKGERLVAIHTKTVAILDDWLIHNRPESTDDYGHEPLLTTRNGRVSANTIRTTIYSMMTTLVLS